MLTVRTIARFYLLRPDPELVEAVKYLMAHYAEKHALTLHAVCVMSTHFHVVAFDKLGHRSLFLRDINRGIANVVKAMRGWRGPVFRPKPNIVRLLTPKAIADKMAYVLANPVAAGAVRQPDEWPGLCVAAGLNFKRATHVKRPAYFFSEGGELPGATGFQLALPATLSKVYGPSGARRILARSLHRHEAKAREELSQRRWKVLGPRHCLKVSPYQRARAYEVFGETEPTFAVLGGGKALYIRAAGQLRAFRRAYRVALEKWRSGQRRTPFPVGTWFMRIHHGAFCSTGEAT